jgi:hypothetical protein
MRGSRVPAVGNASFALTHTRARRLPLIRGAEAAALFFSAHGDQLVAFALLAQGDFLAVHDDIARRLDPEPDLASVHGQHRDFNLVADAHRFAGSPGQYQHDCNVRL